MPDQADSLDLLDRALAQAASVVEAVRPDQLAAPTPCTEWNVRALLNHMVGGLHSFAGVVAGEEMRGFEASVDDASYSSAYRSGAAQLLAAWRTDGALQRPMRLLGAEVPATVALNLQLTETALHAWDLARSTAQAPNLDPELAEQALNFTGRMMTAGRRGTSFGPERSAPPGAGPYERLAAFTGRDIGAR